MIINFNNWCLRQLSVYITTNCGFEKSLVLVIIIIFAYVDVSNKDNLLINTKRYLCR